MQHEKLRLRFIESTVGKHAAVEFAERTKRIYRKAVLQNGKFGKPFHFASLEKYRRGFIESYCVFKRFLRNHEKETY